MDADVQHVHAQQDRRPFSRATLRRIGEFGRPHRARLARFFALTVVMSALAVATPVLAGRVIDAIVGGDDPSVVYALAALIPVIAVADSGLGLLTRWLSSRSGRR